MSSYLNQFKEVLATRNEKQLEAIRAIDGPVIVFAGPGTGKTDVLSLRIGQILHNTDSSPSNILCLTYTDSGATAMRNRLVGYIGPAAYRVSIHTFHSFCHEVIRENPQYFGGYQELQLASDIYRLRILKKVIDEFGVDNPLKRLTGDKYGEANRLSGLFQTMKREHWSSNFMIAKIEAYRKEAELDDEFIYKRNGSGFKKGDFKEKDFDRKVIRPMDKLSSACKAFNRYEYFMKEHKYFDYADMLLWTSNAFDQNPDLLLGYQERYLYFLIDEFQDTNGTQLDIIDQLSKYWDQPNLFVVGDDDQSIYRFQGASKENIIKFKKTYNPREIILNNNYRSSQRILNITNTLIANNTDRLTNNLPEAERKLLASGDYAFNSQSVKITKYDNEVQEEAGVVNEIIKLFRDDKIVDNESVAVIYRNHIHAANIIKSLIKANIPIQVIKRVNILNEALIQNCITLLEYIKSEHKEPHSAEELLFELLHFRFFNISAEHIGMTLLYYRQFKKINFDNTTNVKTHLRDIIASTDHLSAANIQGSENIIAFVEKLSFWLNHYYEYTTQIFFEDILNRSGMLDWILKSEDAIWNLQVINTFFDFIKNESINDPKISLEELINIITEMNDNRINMPLNQIVHSDGGVQFMTAHGSKGLEFDHVFIIKAQSKIWDNIRGGNYSYKYPKNLVEVSADSTEQDERRLFYVAMTRCKYDLNISFADNNKDGKPIMPSLFLNEIKEHGDTSNLIGHVDQEIMINYLSSIVFRAEVKTPLVNKEYIHSWLSGYSLSVTGLNKYLRCPRAFYFEDILRVPAARNLYMGFGNAVHYALQRFFLKEPLGDVKELLGYFEKGMNIYSSHFTKHEYEDRMLFGQSSLHKYYENYSSNWDNTTSYITEYGIDNVFSDGVPIAGKIDRIDKKGLSVNVIDYKTGSFANASKKLLKIGEKSELGGDYWRQIVFYKILLQEDAKNNWIVNDGVIDFVQPNNYGKMKRVVYQVSPDEISQVKTQIANTFEKIKSYQFEDGCQEESCRWCKIVNRYSETKRCL